MYNDFKYNLTYIIALVSGIGTVAMILFPTEIGNLIINNNIIYAIIVVFICFSYAIFKSLPINNISFKITNTTNVTILYGDIFQTEGIIIIPVNEYFDTIVDSEIVSSSTLHGKFIEKIFKNDQENLQAQITNGLKSISSTPDLSRARGNQDKYPLGTVVKIEKNDVIYYLVALTRFNGKNYAEVTREEYPNVITSMFNYIEENNNGHVVNIPLIGGGKGGLDLPKQKILEYLLISMELMNKFSINKGINVILYNTSKKDINLNRIKEIFDLLQDKK